VCTYKAPDDYEDLLYQHKAKLEAAAAAAAARAGSAKQGGLARQTSEALSGEQIYVLCD